MNTKTTLSKWENHPRVLQIINQLEKEESDKLQKEKNHILFKKTLTKLMKDPDYKPWLNSNDCKFYDSNNRFGYLHFYSKDGSIFYQVMREVGDEGIYIEALEQKYKDGESIKELISIAERGNSQ